MLFIFFIDDAFRFYWLFSDYFSPFRYYRRRYAAFDYRYAAASYRTYIENNTMNMLFNEYC